MLCELLVHHNLPFTAADTFTKAVKRMFPDSQIAKELQCGRKKATGLVKELAHMRQIDIVTRMKNQVFTVSTDGSNDDKSKQFPIVVRTFDTSTGFMNSEVLSNTICEGSATG